MRQVSLCLLIKENKGSITEILLAMKKRGFGQGRWNGVGGKTDIEKGETVFDSAIREAEEEIGVKIKNPEKAAIIDFYFPEQPKEKNWDQQVHLFLVKEWEGEPIESEEMLPKWFEIGKIPFDEMWDDDRYWLPHILEGKKLKAKFSFDKEDRTIEKIIELVEKLD
ncbi:8-oxo-dGTP diphosphatase [Patescibacteria group bacterium]|nr:8-oxo-dGTP diphosphatase [Patescibacteria group bacterium]MBU4458296.1 8-oxo-dGTP diphosphatase [Patescibacteria group bacterium]MCG2696211.1 8-oxo-dGTP diphosphatase [Candidatus Portnoybacteria bacterium]